MWRSGCSRVDSVTVEHRDAIVNNYVKRGQLDFREFAPRNQVENP